MGDVCHVSNPYHHGMVESSDGSVSRFLREQNNYLVDFSVEKSSGIQNHEIIILLDGQNRLTFQNFVNLLRPKT